SPAGSPAQNAWYSPAVSAPNAPAGVPAISATATAAPNRRRCAPISPPRVPIAAGRCPLPRRSAARNRAGCRICGAPRCGGRGRELVGGDRGAHLNRLGVADPLLMPRRAVDVGGRQIQQLDLVLVLEIVEEPAERVEILVAMLRQ